MNVLSMRAAWLVALAALLPSPVDALTGEAVGPLADSRDKVAVTVNPSSYRSFFLDLPSNVDTLRVTLAGPGNADLLIRAGIPHDASSVDELVAQSIAVSRGPSSNEAIELRRNGEPALTPGRWWFTVLNLDGMPVTVDLVAEVTTAGAPFVVAPGQSGTWFDPDKNLQGFFIQNLNAAQVFVAWFTYTPDGDQAYLFGIGDIEGDRIEIETLVRTSGTGFGEGFDPSQVVSEDWGDLTLVFESCDRGYVAFFPQRAEWPFDHHLIQQLTSIPGLDCPTSKDQAAPKYVGTSVSGTWYDPGRSGEGFVAQAISEDLGVLYWFTFDPDGKQAWFGGLARVVNGSLFVENATLTRGGIFGPDYSPSQVSSEDWGQFAITLTGCASAALYAVGPATWGEHGSESMERLTGVAGVEDCDHDAEPLQLSGQIRPTAVSHYDGDVNDPATPNRDNDSVAQAQPLANPAVVSGFLAQAPTGIEGDRFATSTDVNDLYRVTLSAGQSIQLLISDWSAQAPNDVDFDLYLFRASDTSQPLQSALGTDRNEFITVAETGEFILAVNAFAGHGNYVLAVGSAPAPAQASALRLEDAAVADEIVVRFKEPWDDGLTPSALFKSIAQREAALGGLQWRKGAPGRPQLFQLPTAGRDRVLEALGVPIDRGKLADAGGLGLATGQRQRLDTLYAIKALRAHPEVRYAEPNGRYYTQGTPSDPRFREQWHYPMINLPQAWDISRGAANVVVAVIDTGVNPHPDLAPNLLSDLGFDAIGNVLNACDGNGRDFDARDPGDGCGTQAPDSFHGTHVAGTVAAADDNGIAGTGVAPLAKIMPVRVLGKDGGTGLDIADGIAWAAGETVGGARANRAADVINLSLGGPGGCPSLYQEVINRARARGISVVAAAGNSNSSGNFVPADCPGVIKVAAVNRRYQASSYSNCRDIDIAAPGGQVQADPAGSALYAPRNAQACKGPRADSAAVGIDGVLSTLSRRGQFDAPVEAFYQGTSMASPHVAGVIALMKAVHPGLSAGDVDALIAAERISAGANAQGLTGEAAANFRFFFGAGLIDALAAVRAARELSGSQELPTSIVAQPMSLDFGDVTEELTLTFTRMGNAPGGLSSLTTDVPWLSGGGGGADGLGEYRLAVDRGDLPAAEYEGTIVAVTTLDTTLRIPVRMRVGAARQDGESGTLYALLLDAMTLQIVARDGPLLVEDGAAPFAFDGILPGRYFLVYGTDGDNDGFICDAGEPCSMFPPGANAGPLELEGGDVDIGSAPLNPDLRGIGVAEEVPSKRMAGVLAKALKRERATSGD